MARDEGTLVNAEVGRTQAEKAAPRGVILVEGVSDQMALEALARRRGRNLEAEGISVVPMGGATNIRRFFGSKGSRKSRFGALLVEALDLAEVPRPLDRVLAHL